MLGGIFLRIGIPKALLYYRYFPLWKAFFEELGHEVVPSSSTNNSILNNGVKNCVDDACLPVKLFHGHVMDLKGRVDKIFIPRLISIEPGEFICPKFIGLPEMVKNSVPDNPNLLILNFNAHKSLEKGYDGFHVLGKELGASNNEVSRAMTLSKAKQEIYEKRLENGSNPLTLLENKFKLPTKSKVKGTIGLVGHPYLLYDQYINMSVCSKLVSKGYLPLFPENISSQQINEACSRFPKKLFWSYGKHLLGSGLSMLEHKNIKGLIFITSFGCGIDSFVGELLQRYNQREFLIPFSMITLDEHSGHAGFDTRLEAFIDMMEWRGNIDYHVSPHGTDVYPSKSTF